MGLVKVGIKYDKTSKTLFLQVSIQDCINSNFVFNKNTYIHLFIKHIFWEPIVYNSGTFLGITDNQENKNSLFYQTCILYILSLSEQR